MLAPLAAALLVAGAVALLLAASPAGKVIGLVVAVIALLLLGITQGLYRSARLDELAERERQLDAAILATAGSCGSDCGCVNGSAACGVDDCAVRSLFRH